MTKFHLVLGSKSPRRKELFDYLGINYLQLSSDAEEVSEIKDPPAFALDIAKQKAVEIQKILNDKYAHLSPFLVTSDTIVAMENKILGKPKSIDEARDFLNMMSGSTHHVYTAVYCSFGDDCLEFVDKTDVTFNVLDATFIEKYLKTGDSMDKAGAYGAQGMAQIFIKEIAGSHSNVIGFPMSSLISHLQKAFPSSSSIDELFDNGDWVS